MGDSLRFDPFVIQQKYAEERDKRIRPDGLDQYVELEKSDKFRDLNNDPWVDHAALNAKPSPLRNGSHVKFLILGAGYGGLLMAARLIQSGFSADDIRLVDNAGGFGGTWYWNRYPGLHCDVESYIYMPLLEETGYMPKRKYAPGVELLEHAERIAEQWKLQDKALFRANVQTCAWEDEKSAWSVSLTESRGPGAEAVSMSVTADFVVVASGIFPHPHIPKLDGLDKFKGDIFHTARWNYTVTGGSPSDPKLDLLKDKTVAIIGTGATAIQVVPRLAESCKQLLVFQRTPSSVDTRGQRDTDPDEWKTSIASSPGWQRRRQDNFNDCVTRSQGEADVDLVGDGWTNVPAYCSLLGSTCKPPVTPDKIPEHIGWLYGLDLPHGERIRRRVDDVVTDKHVADSLKPWYPGWCKRPCFSDEYLQAFNRGNVTLVDTGGRGVSGATERGLVVDGVEYPVDILVLSTGYTSPGKDGACPTVRTGVVVRGRDGVDFKDKWMRGVATLYGNMTHGFPNLFLLGPGQAGSAANNVWMLDRLVENTAYIVSQAAKRVGGGGSGRCIVEATREAEEAWAMEIVKRAGWFAGVGGCTPGYLNAEGSYGRNVSSPEDMLKMARGAGWAEGPSSFARVLESWRAEGSMKGVEVRAV